jgi:hypothetical protein
MAAGAPVAASKAIMRPPETGRPRSALLQKPLATLNT